MLERADVAVAEAVAPVRDHPAVRIAGTIGEIADQPQLITLCSAVLAVGLLGSNARLARTGARMLAAELVATGLKNAVKRRVVRTRPEVIDDGGDYEMEEGRDRSSEMSSFPSGHTAGAVAVALTVGREYPWAGLGALTAAAAVAAIQIPRSKHFVSDVTAGAMVGAAAAGTVFLTESVVGRLLSGRARGRQEAGDSRFRGNDDGGAGNDDGGWKGRPWELAVAPVDAGRGPVSGILDSVSERHIYRPL